MKSRFIRNMDKFECMLRISLLERKINEGIEEGKKWSLVYGFPECIQELLGFEEKVGLTHVNKTLAYIR